MDKAYLKRALFYLLAAILSVALIVYIGYHVRKYFTKEVETTPAKLTEQSFTVRADAYVFRTEKPLSTAATGTFAPCVADGEHVHVGETVAEIYSVADPQAQAELAAGREQLALLKEYSATKRGAKDAAAVDLRIYSLMRQMKSLAARNDLAGVCEMRSELLAELNERQVASGVSSGNFDELIAAVNASIEEQKGKLGSVLAAVTAPESGWFYAAVDGYESAFDPAKLDSMTVESFEQLIGAAPEPVKNGAGKLALDYKWYIALEIGAAEVAGLEPGTRCDVSFAYNGGQTVEMTVERTALGAGKTKALVVLSSSRLAPGFSFARRQTVDVSVESLTGLSVPRSAVRLVDGVEGVYVFDGVYANFRRVEVLREYEDVYIVKTDVQIAAERADETAEAAEFAAPSPPEGESQTEAAFDAKRAPYLSENDLIIIEGKGLYDGKVIS